VASSIKGERKQARSQAKDYGWCSLLLSYLSYIKENTSYFELFVSNIATRISGTSRSNRHFLSQKQNGDSIGE